MGCEPRDGDDERALPCEGLVVDEAVMVTVNLLLLVGKREYIPGLRVWGFICTLSCRSVLAASPGLPVASGPGFVSASDATIGSTAPSGERGSGSSSRLLAVAGVWLRARTGRRGTGGRGNAGGGEGCSRVIPRGRAGKPGSDRG